jgi:hypothetical protein
MAVIINQPNSEFKYNPDIVLNNWSFNLSIGAVLGMGLTSTLLACFAPKASKPFDWCSSSSSSSSSKSKSTKSGKTKHQTSTDTVDIAE